MSQVHAKLTLKAVSGDEGRLALRCPEVGHFAGALPRGAALAPGMSAGVLHQLGKSFDLIVPEGAGGAVVSEPPRLALEPVGFGAVLYELDPAGVAALEANHNTGAGAQGDASGLAVMAGQSGRVWHSPAPGDPPFVAPGGAVEEGAALCLIEVMKTFSTVPYRATGGLPARGKVVRWLVEDGGDVEAGMPLLEIEPA